MGTNLITNYVNTYNTKPVTQQVPAASNNFVNTNTEELDTRVYIKPLKGRGKLVKGNIFDAPAIMVKDLIYSAKSIKHASKGQANDHELGKINDVGMLLGGLSIASYLVTKRQQPLSKAMEFVGLGSFFASMAIWPKLAIQLPAKLIYGIDVQQQYIDSFGRKKPFYLDPQFLPWDLYSEEEIYKFGDRLGVPKDIPNRRDFIQEKMKKIATQNNTLWMMTAGFATPIMSSLICNKLERPVENMLMSYRKKQADNLMNNFPEAIESAKSQKLNNRISRIIELNKGQVIDEKLFTEILNAYSEGMDLVTKEGLKTDLRQMLFNDKYEINIRTVENILKNIEQQFEGNALAPNLKEILPKQSELIKALKDKNLFNKELGAVDLNGAQEEILITIRKKVAEYNRNHKNAPIKWTEFVATVTNTVKDDDPTPIMKGLKTFSASRLSADIQKKMVQLSKALTDFNATKSVLRKYLYMKVSKGPSELAHFWNNVAADVIDIFEFSPKEIEKARFDKELTAKLLRERMELIAQDETKFNAVMQKLAQKVSKITKIMPTDNAFAEKLDTIDNDIVPKLRDEKSGLNMKNLIKRLIGVEFNEKNYKWEDGQRILVGRTRKVDPRGSYKATMKQFEAERMLGVESSYFRLMHTLERFRALSIGENVKELTHGHPQEVKEELIEAVKKAMIQEHASDYAVKGYMKRNPHPDATKTGGIVRRAGQIIYQIFGKNPEVQKVDIPYDAGFFQEKMKLLFENPLLKDTENTLRQHGLLEKMNDWKARSLSALADQKYFAKKHHLIGGGTNDSAMYKFLLTGIAPDEFLFNVFNQKFNTNKWFKMFGGIGAALLAGTVGAQFLFGKLKTPETVQKG